MESTTTIVRESAVLDALRNAILSLNSTIHGGIDEQSSFLYRSILHDTSLNSKEKSAALIQLNHLVDVYKVSFKDGSKRFCDQCEKWCYSIEYCELCIRQHLEKQFMSWTSGNQGIDELIRKCQLNTLVPYGIVEWIPYENFNNVQFKSKNFYSTIFNAVWSQGPNEEWLPESHSLYRSGPKDVILKRLDNFKNHGNDWFEEAESYLTLNMKLGYVVTCYGITKDPTTSDYMIVMRKMDYDLKEFVKDNANNVSNLSWSKKYSIIKKIADCLLHIHEANSIHKNLHSGNVLYSSELKDWNNQKYLPENYILLMKQCWDADPVNRPNAEYIYNRIIEILDRYYGEDKFEADEGIELLERKEEPCLMQSSRLYRFKNLPKPRNANSSNSDNNNNSNQQIGSCHKRNYSFQFSEDIYTVS
ncbi:3111_t:CDS:2 [Entrophospora sp. SA101]|nr:22999_t:CDS:2 [Entrophospora sp. SA101]CAJ0758940.1 3111_t:CDS:2 [Entrophospora sp. SA101]